MADTTQKSLMETQKIIAAPLTPLFEDGEINFGMLEQCADYMAKTYVTGIFINGSLAEGVSMTMSERKQLAEQWMKVAKGRFQVIVHVGSNCLKDCKELAKHAQEIGADSITAFAPSYYKPENEEILVQFMEEVAGAAPKLGFYYYDINFMTGVYINCRKFLEMARGRIPNLRGIKHSSREMTSAHNCVLGGEGLEILMGSDVQYLSALTLGMDGVVSNMYLGNLYHDLQVAFDNKDLAEARAVQTKTQEIMNIRAKYGGGGNVSKNIFRILTGIEVGPVRLPQRQMTPDQIEAMRRDFEEAGFLDVAKPRA